MFSLVDFEDLILLDGGDLRAVLGQLPDDQLIAAFGGTPASLRRRLLLKLSPGLADRLEAQIHARGPIPSEDARSAQRAVVDALCRLSRSGQIAFDVPEDMVA